MAEHILRPFTLDEDMINAVCEEEKELIRDQANARLDWINEQLLKQPHSENWKDVAFCNKFHFGIGPQVTKRVKRRRGKKYRYKKENVYLKKLATKDIKLRQGRRAFKAFEYLRSYRLYIS
jgi:hypothetical protein